jgi:hypothetical protein
MMITNQITYTRPSLDVEYDYVGIIDGLEPADRKKFGITEQLKALLNGAGFTTALTLVSSKAELLGALEAFRVEATAGRRFMLHFVSHGNDDGIEVGTEFADWATLRPFLQRIHAATEETLLLNMSTCRGLHGVKMVDAAGAFPFFGLIGAKEDLYVHDALDANRRIYSKWMSGMPVQQLVPETNAELGRDVLFNLSAEGYRILTDSKLSTP